MIMAALLIGCKEKEYKVVYDVTCKDCLVTYATSSGTEQRVCGGMHYEFNSKQGEQVYLSAMNNTDKGALGVVIKVDDVIFKTASASGGYVTATATGTL